MFLAIRPLTTPKSSQTRAAVLLGADFDARSHPFFLRPHYTYSTRSTYVDSPTPARCAARTTSPRALHGQRPSLPPRGVRGGNGNGGRADFKGWLPAVVSFAQVFVSPCSSFREVPSANPPIPTACRAPPPALRAPRAPRLTVTTTTPALPPAEPIRATSVPPQATMGGRPPLLSLHPTSVGGTRMALDRAVARAGGGL